MRKPVIPTAALMLALGACGSEEPDSSLPDPRSLFEVHEHAKTYRDDPFLFEVPTLLRTERELPDLHVTALASLGDELFVGTASRLLRLGAEDPLGEIELVSTGSVADLSVGGERLYALRPDRVDVLGRGGTVIERFVRSSTATPTAVAEVGGTVLVGTQSGLELLDANGSRLLPLARGLSVRDLLAEPGGAVWVASDRGILRLSGDLSRILDGPTLLAEVEVPALAIGPEGKTVLAASAAGLSEISVADLSSTLVLPGVDGLPTGDLRAVATDGQTILLGHRIGATALSEGNKDHYHTERWIPAEEVTAVALGPQGQRWIGTEAGLSRIALEEWTLARKAELFEEMLEARHVRMDGFVTAQVSYDDPWDQAGPPSRGDDDNDGQWTETQLGAWCFAFASTGEERFYRSARRTMEVMLMLFDLPGATFKARGMPEGFISRSLVRDDEGPVFSSKADQPNWHLQEYEGRSYYWKDNTSADEYDGHFFGLPIYYDLCAQTEEERRRIRDRLRLAMDYLIDNDYWLIDLDGEPTSDGRWRDLAIAADGLDACVERHGYDKLEACVSSRHGGGWLNSIEVLAYLLATWHVTEDPKYYLEYERLHTEERLGEMIPVTEETFTVSEPAFANHSDHEMAMLVYHTLIRYEPNPDRRERWIRSMLDFHEYERPERNPFELGVIASAWSPDVDLEGAIRTLRELPIDWRAWRYDNSHRQDARRGVPDRFREAQFVTVLPYDEIRSAKWNESPYQVVGGSDGRQLVVPMPYQIAYWMMRYYGLIEGSSP